MCLVPSTNRYHHVYTESNIEPYGGVKRHEVAQKREQQDGFPAERRDGSGDDTTAMEGRDPQCHVTEDSSGYPLVKHCSPLGLVHYSRGLNHAVHDTVPTKRHAPKIVGSRESWEPGRSRISVSEVNQRVHGHGKREKGNGVDFFSVHFIAQFRGDTVEPARVYQNDV